MSLITLFAGMTGLALPFIAGYAISVVRNLEDIVPDVEVIAADSTSEPEAVREDASSVKQQHSPAQSV
jgi:hypothetical protein